MLGGIGSIYRGPLVVIGTGAALLAIILANKEIPIPYLYSIWLGADGHAGQHGPDQLVDAVDDRLHQGQPRRSSCKTALPFGCLMVAVNSLICYLMLGSLQ